MTSTSRTPASAFCLYINSRGKMLLIGFGYKARRGKDTAISAILEARSHLRDIRRYAFADALRDEVHAAMREESESYGLTYREALALLFDKAGVGYDTN